jgi:hypothetical protein
MQNLKIAIGFGNLFSTQLIYFYKFLLFRFFLPKGLVYTLGEFQKKDEITHGISNQIECLL